ncbi:MAG: hypothetical protein ACRDJE_17245, partial [Dehalococcoidia bacterium]
LLDVEGQEGKGDVESEDTDEDGDQHADQVALPLSRANRAPRGETAGTGVGLTLSLSEIAPFASSR